jgi:diguanylate cyclase (GGDEF)-like protein/PAS domain S-box-containing protein
VERLESAREPTQQRQLFDRAQAIAHIGSWDWDLATNVLTWSDEHYRIFGLDRATFAPTMDNALRLIHEEDLPGLKSAIDASVASGEPYSSVVRVRRPTGEIRWIESVGVPAILNGKVVNMVGTMLDVTDRELSHAQLRDSEAMHKMIVETAREAIWVIDADANTTFANGQLTVLLGRPHEELIGAPVFAFIGEDRRASAAATFEGLRRGEASRFDSPFVRPDGSEVWALISAVPIHDADGNYSGALAMLTDITERHEAEIKLHDSEARLAEAQRLARFGSWAFDVHTRVLTCSDEVFVVLGIDPARGIASFERLPLLVHPDDRARSAAFLDSVQTDYGEASDEFRIATPEGEERWIAVRTAPVIDANGRVAEMRGTLQDITERKASEAQLVHVALHDMVTGLPNRSLFTDRLEHALARRETSVGVMLLDLDGFKAINDSLGHAAGDILLAAVAEMLSATLRPADTIARFGGDEFTILLEDTDEATTIAAAKRILHALALPLAVLDRNVLAQASIGVAIGTAPFARADQLLRDADAAMYAAKRNGGSRYELFNTDLHAAVVERLALECDLRTVELGGEMTLAYQPVVALDDGRLHGFEALLRWQHPRRGPIPPDEFVPLAEHTGAIVPIGRWVVEEACRQVRLWQQHYPAADGLMMSVNVSARQLADPDFVADVDRALATSGLDPRLLTLEITETMIMEDEAEAAGAVRALKALGVRISVDDFGTGYSSLGYLDRFPIDELKVDRSFVCRLGDEVEDSGVALAVIRLAHSLRIEVVAEGIETEEQLVLLRDANCARGQGYYFWRPLTVAAVESMLTTGSQSRVPSDVRRVVLVVDDEDPVRESTVRQLADAGFETLEAATGTEALAVARAHRVDAVVLDAGLPDMTGLEVCAILREQSAHDVAVVFLSGSRVAMEDRVQALDVGAVAYLIKPAAAVELVATLRAVLRDSERRPAAVAVAVAVAGPA